MLLKIIVRIWIWEGWIWGGGKERKPLWGELHPAGLCAVQPLPVSMSRFCFTIWVHQYWWGILNMYSCCRLHGLNTAVHACTLYIFYVRMSLMIMCCTPVCTLELLEVCTLFGITGSCTFAITQCTCSVWLCSKLIVFTLLWNSISILSLS